MKRILFSITVMLVVFSFNISYSQDVSIDGVLDNLPKKMWPHFQEIGAIKKDFWVIIKNTDNMNQKSVMFDLLNGINDASDIYDCQLKLLFTKLFVDESKMKPYYEFIHHTLKMSYVDLDNAHKTIQDYYTLVENKAALHSADKAKKILRDSLSEIESTMTLLDNAIKSMP